MNDRTRFSTMAIPAFDVPRSMAEAYGRPVVVMRARRGGRRRFEKTVAAFGERAVQILDADGYVLFVVRDPAELASIVAATADAPAEIEITAWNEKGDPVALNRGAD